MTNTRHYQICRRCIMDTTDPNITFDSDGACCYCKIFDDRMKREVVRGVEGERKLNIILDKIKKDGKGRDYDCLIGVSGGVDSTMAVWTLRKFGLRMLAIHLDNGWDSELAVDNIKKTLDKLGVDLYTHVLDWEEFRDIQLAFFRSSVPNCEIPTDHAIVALHFKVAREHNIHYIVNGGNVVTEAFVPVAWAYDARDTRHLKAIHRKFGTIPMKSFPTISIFNSLLDVFVRKISWINVLNYVDYNKQEAIKLLQDQLGWRPYGGKHYESVYTRFYQGYILKEKFGFDKKRAHLSCLVLAGDITRNHALEEIKKEDYIGKELWAEDREFVIKKFGLTEQEFNDIMRQPPKWHYDYPNNSLIFERLPNLFRSFKKIATKV